MLKPFFVLTALFAGSTAVLAASLRGNVLDVIKQQGVGGVKVFLIDSKGQRVGERITNSEGVYTFPDVNTGSYTVRLEPTGYVPNPHEIPNLPVKNDPEQAPDTKLWAQKASNDEYARGGVFIARYAMDKNGKTAAIVYQSLWRDLSAGQLSAVSKFHIVRGIQGTDKNAKTTFPPFNQYLIVNPEHLDKLQIDFRHAIEGKDGIPTKAKLKEFRVSDPVLSDIVIFELNASTVSFTGAQKFVAEYRTMMGPSKSTGAVEGWLKGKMGKRIYEP